MGFFGDIGRGLGTWLDPRTPYRQIRGYYHTVKDSPGVDTYKRAASSGMDDITARPGEQAQVDQAAAAGNFANVGESGFNRMQGNLDRSADWLNKVASGQESVSREQLRQAAESNIATQKSMAAGAAPRDAAMAAFGASRNAADIGSGLAGQQQIAGQQERDAAQRALAELQLGRSGQYLQAGLGSRQTAMGMPPGQSWLDKYGGMIQGGASMIAMCDEDLKTDVEDAGAGLDEMLAKLEPVEFRYKDRKHGAGRVTGIMAQDLQQSKAGARLVKKTPDGLAVDVKGAAVASLAALGRLNQRLSKLEQGGK